MYCNRCHMKNIDGVNFCYNCGHSFSGNKINRINNDLLSDNISGKKVFSLKKFTYDNLISSKYKHRNIFVLLSIIVLCSALSVPLYKGLPESFNCAITFVNTYAGHLSKEFLKNQTELFFRDVFIRIILIISFICLVVFNIIILLYTAILNKQKMKNYKN